MVNIWGVNTVNYVDIRVKGSLENVRLSLFNPTHQIVNPFGLNNYAVKITDKQFEQIIKTLTSRFKSQGVLIEVIKYARE